MLQCYYYDITFVYNTESHLGHQGQVVAEYMPLCTVRSHVLGPPECARGIFMESAICMAVQIKGKERVSAMRSARLNMGKT